MGIARAEFHHYLRRLVEAGFEDRIMFGSERMWIPETIEASVDAVNEAGYLSAPQKRAIFYDNAARFLRLSDAVVARHHGR
jgi:hypothetical protein